MASEACIIGGGVIGCAVAFELRKRGLEVTVLDKNGEVGHGSTSASCGIVRRFYSQPGMTAMAHESAQIWADWGGHLGPIDEELAVFKRPGMAFLLTEITDDFRERVAGMQQIGVPAQLMTTDELHERFPYLDVASQDPPRSIDDPDFLEAGEARPIGGAVFEEDAGYVVSPGLATHNLRLAAEREGVRFLLNREVRSVSGGDGARFTLELSDGSTVESDVVVNVAGPHSSRVNALAGVTLPLETRPLVREVHALDNPLRGTPPGQTPPDRGRPRRGDLLPPGVRGQRPHRRHHRPGLRRARVGGRPGHRAHPPLPAVPRAPVPRAMRRFPELRLGRMKGVVSLYDVTVQDWYPIVDKTDRAGYYVCIGTSGSSFKTAPVLGSLVAEIVTATEQGRDVDQEPHPTRAPPHRPDDRHQLPLPPAGDTGEQRYRNWLTNVPGTPLARRSPLSGPPLSAARAGRRRLAGPHLRCSPSPRRSCAPRGAPRSTAAVHARGRPDPCAPWLSPGILLPSPLSAPGPAVAGHSRAMETGTSRLKAVRGPS